MKPIPKEVLIPERKTGGTPSRPAPSAGADCVAHDDRGRRVVFVRGEPPMSEEKLRLALGSLDADSPAWRAINQLIDMELASAVMDASEPRDYQGTYPGGKVAALAELKKRIHDYRAGGVGADSARKGRG